jgi:hypothetical protein
MGIKGLVAFSAAQAGTEQGAEFINALVKTKFFWPFEKFLETLFGLLLVTNRYICVAVNGLAAIIVNIVLYHAFLDPYHSYLAIIVFVCEVYMYMAFWRCNFRNSFVKKVEPWA